MHLILASASPRRTQLLKQIGVTPNSVIPADIDETPSRGELPRDHALRLAKEKAEKVAKDRPESFVLAADTVVACGRRILPKTEDITDAKTCLKLLSGRTHHVYGGIALITPDGETISRVSDTKVHFKNLGPKEMQSYLESGEWQGVAGGYAIQGLASAYIKNIRGSYSNVVGLCVYDTMRMLTGAGYLKA